MNKVEAFIFEYFEPKLKSLGYCFADVEYIKLKDNQYLKLYIDSLDGKNITISDCEKVSRYLDEKLDNEVSMLNKEYILEVSSPGNERPLRRVNDYQMFLGSKIQVILYKPLDNQKQNIGVLNGVIDELYIELQLLEKKQVISIDNIAKANLYYEF